MKIIKMPLVDGEPLNKHAFVIARMEDEPEIVIVKYGEKYIVCENRLPFDEDVSEWFEELTIKELTVHVSQEMTDEIMMMIAGMTDEIISRVVERKKQCISAEMN